MIGGLILAAGGGSRFGGGKLVAELGGRPVLAHSIETMLGVQAIERTVVVLGSGAGAIREAIPFEGFEALECPEWAEGIAASLRCGVRALAECEALVITLGDQPLVSSEAIVATLEALGDSEAARATYDGAPGHPVVVRRSLFGAIARLAGDSGAQELLERAGVRTFEAGALCGPDDVDTTDDLESIRGRLAEPGAAGGG